MSSNKQSNSALNSQNIKDDKVINRIIVGEIGKSADIRASAAISPGNFTDINAKDVAVKPLSQEVIKNENTNSPNSIIPAAKEDNFVTRSTKYLQNKLGELSSEHIFTNPLARRVVILGLCTVGAIMGPATISALTGITLTAKIFVGIASAVACGFGGDVMRHRTIKQLASEEVVLAKYNKAVNEKKVLIEQNPELAKLLENKLDSITYNPPNLIIRGIKAVKNIIKDNAPTHLSEIEKKIPLDKISAFGLEIAFHPKNKDSQDIEKNKEEIARLTKEYRKELLEARAQLGYNNLSELKEKAHEERINILAFREVAKQGNINTKEEAEAAFNNEVDKIKQRVTLIQESHGVGTYFKGLWQDVVNSQSYATGYNIAENIKKEVISAKTSPHKAADVVRQTPNIPDTRQAQKDRDNNTAKVDNELPTTNQLKKLIVPDLKTAFSNTITDNAPESNPTTIVTKGAVSKRKKSKVYKK